MNTCKEGFNNHHYCPDEKCEYHLEMAKHAPKSELTVVKEENTALKTQLARHKKALETAVAQRNLVHAEYCDDVKCMKSLDDQIAAFLEGGSELEWELKLRVALADRQRKLAIAKEALGLWLNIFDHRAMTGAALNEAVEKTRAALKELG